MRILNELEITTVTGGGKIWDEFQQALEDILESVLELFQGEKPSD